MTYEWVPFYEELAGKLLIFKDDRKPLIKKIVGMYELLGMKVPTLDSTAVPADVDPYTVYGLFNKGISDANRRKLTAAVSSEFGMQATSPNDFAGIPMLNNLNATFYAFTGDKRRKDGDVDRLWTLFETEIALADDDGKNNRSRFEEAYDAAVHQFGLGWKLTMGLYWARPRRFIALDSRNRWFMGDKALAGKAVSSVAPRENGDPVPTGGQYLGICDTILASIEDGGCPYASLPEIFRAAWEESERVNRERKAAQKAAEKKAEEDALGDDDIVVNDVVTEAGDLPAYTREDFLAEAYLEEDQYDAIIRRLQIKKNVVLQGPPGVGKTFVAKRLAYSMIEVKDPLRVELVQFHQSYSYEDFVEGYRPTEAGFEIEHGVFYDFCKKAADDSDNDYFFIIDEINRGNLSRIFGELFMLIEADKRGERNKLRLLYSHDYFFVPSNVYLIGMMNTADRSLALLDYALRRRFDFFDLAPAFDSDGFRSYQEGVGSSRLDRLVSCVERLNDAISADDSLGDGFCIGHSYLCGLTQEAIEDGALSDIVEYELLPLLHEYWFDDPDQVSTWAGELRGAAK